MKKKTAFETSIQIVLIFLLFVLCVLITLGITWDFRKLKTVTFWVETAIRFSMVITVFNIVYYLQRKNQAHEKQGRFHFAYMTNRLKIKYLEDNRLFDQLDDAVAQENKERLVLKVNALLHKYCTRIFYEDVMKNLTPEKEDPTYEEIDDLVHRFRVFNKYQKKFIRLVEKIRAGRITVPPIKATSFLRDKELTKLSFETYDYSDTASAIERNLQKGATFLGISIILSAIGFSFVSPDFLRALFMNLLSLTMAVVSGIFSANNSLKKKTRLYEARNSFLKRRLDINIEYQE